ncbi:YafY family transcriptional regulator [Massilia forsythiae]|uniref:YafY family transcriptional regulator n=1 Tax=Massilia forsythiae TaxID=2728020 RepID=A0A7Z2VUD6_9BURK|nr:YafY family protein [Massilia forsythiae]QJD99647.1 YafY family transcriptional regulator [Massilia forsythiae]
MTRAQRLLALLQALRRRRLAVKGEQLAAELGVSLRTLYRDIATLREQGARIEGEPGLGYVLQPGFLLPPLMFTQDEIEALVLGGRWVARHGDAQIAAAAREAVAKIAAVLPPAARRTLDTTALLVAGARDPVPEADMAPIRAAIRAGVKLDFAYCAGDGETSRRTVWPLALGFMERVRMLVAWCELRQDYRHFRLDRIGDLQVSGERYPGDRHAMLRDWHASQGIPEQAADGS